jgi:hypothetical protein
MLVSITSLSGIIPFRFPGTRGFDYPLNLARGQLVGIPSLRFLADNPTHVGLRGGEADIILYAEQYRLGRAALLDDDRAALILNAAQKLAKIRTRAVRTRLSSRAFHFSA